jgi:hypothetical protein
MKTNTIEETWNAFSKLKNTELKYKERKQGDVTQAHYLINYSTEVATFSFIGIVFKSNEVSKNSDKTSIIIEFKNPLAITNFDIKINLEVSQNETSEFEKSLLNSLKIFNGNSITLNNPFIRIDTDCIFSTVESFEQVESLVNLFR